MQLHQDTSFRKITLSLRVLFGHELPIRKPSEGPLLSTENIIIAAQASTEPLDLLGW